MEETIKLELTKEEAAQVQQVIGECLRRIDSIREEMARDQVEIEQYGAATQAVIDRIQGKAA
jgi:hypothetical protein